MKKNLSSPDRLIRLLVLVVVAILYYTGQITGTAALVLGIIGIVLAATALINFCPIYWALGISTKKQTSKL